MDLTSLPVEMTASILKYLEPNELLRLRNMNVYLNTVAKRYGFIKRLVVEEFSICKDEFLNPFEIFLEIEKESIKSADNSDSGRNFSCPPENLLEKLNELARKIVISSSLDLLQDFPVDMGFLRMIQANKSAFKKVQSLMWIEPVIYLSSENLKLLFRCFPKVGKIRISPNMSCASLLSAEVLGNRKWSSLQIHAVPNLPRSFLDKLDDRFLCEVVTKSAFFNLEDEDLDTKFTIKGLAEMMKIVLSESAPNKDLRLGKISLGDLRFSEVKPFLVAALPGVEVSVDYKKEPDTLEHLVDGNLSFGDDGRSTVFLTIRKPVDNSRKRKASQNLDDI